MASGWFLMEEVGGVGDSLLCTLALKFIPSRIQPLPRPHPRAA